MTPPDDARSLLATLRPQPFGRTSSQAATDPIIEPLWLGIRALAAIDPEGAEVVDEDGDPVTDQDRVVKALAWPSTPTASSSTATSRSRRRTTRAATSHHRPTSRRPPGRRSTGCCSVSGATAPTNASPRWTRLARPGRSVRTTRSRSWRPICLWLEGESLLHVPLLERKRILESVVIESEVVRLGLYVRPPIEPWIGSWRTQGFTGLTFKSANSRYSPGVASKDWASTPMPRR